ncbi:MAG: VTT domain-containing protein [Candidatus Thorarchaeota archaeon]
MDRVSVGAAVVAFMIGVYWFATLLNPDIVGPILATYEWLVAISLGAGYAGAFIVSLLGNATVLVPFPYVGVPFILGGARDPTTHVFLFDPTIVGIVAGAGALIGEMTGYVAGYLGGGLVNQEKRSRFRELAADHPWATPFLLWFLAATPIPDDVLVVPLGASRYDWWKVAIPQFVGKTMFLAAIAWAGRFGLDWVDTLVASTGSGGVLGTTMETLGLLLVVFIVYMMLRNDHRN